MNTLATLEKMRLMIPDVKWVRKGLTDLRIKTLHLHYLPEKDIREAYGKPEVRKEKTEIWEKKNSRAAARLKKEIGRLAAANPEAARLIEQEDYLAELKYCCCAYGFLPCEYVIYDLYSKSEEEWHEFISNLEAGEKSYQMNDVKDMALFRDKGLTYDLFKEYFHRECIVIEKPGDFEAFRDFTARHPVFVRKHANESCGKTISLVDLPACREDPRQLFDAMIREGKHILEERIVQSGELAFFNASSVNTVRCATILTRHGPEVAFCFLKTGRAGSFVDNGGAGGILIGIDADTGVLNTSGVEENGIRFERHPDSGAAFEGCQLPDWQEMIRICREAAVIAGRKGCRYAGWDMAHTEQYGWVMVEGNGSGQFIGPQLTSRKGIRKKIESLMAEL